MKRREGEKAGGTPAVPATHCFHIADAAPRQVTLIPAGFDAAATRGRYAAMTSLLRFLVITAALLTVGAAFAHGYPEQGIRIVVGFPPGVAPDITARLLADKFGEAWGKPVVVENVTGAGSNIATDRVAKAAPDGYTLLMGGNSALVISPSLYDRLPYDPVRDFAPISQVFIAAN